MTTLTIHITKEVLAKAAYCGIDASKQFRNKDTSNSADNCAITVAADSIIPGCGTGMGNIYFPNGGSEISLPMSAQIFIQKFDALKRTFRDPVSDRMNMQPFSFDISVSDEQLDMIMALHNVDMDKLLQMIEDCPTMELVKG